MENNPTTWQERFGLTTCAATALGESIPPAALGVAVLYARTAEGEKIYLVIESRAGSLRDQCARRLQTAKLPPASELTVAFKAGSLTEASPEAVHAACREQVLLAGE